MSQIPNLIAGLQNKNRSYAYQCLQQLLAESAESDAVYAYFDQFAGMMDSPNSFVRTRGILLIAANVQWDEAKRLDGCMNRLLTHITDEKPIMARQCIQALPTITAQRPDWKERIAAALRQADLSAYQDSMRPLIEADIKVCLQQL